MPEIITYSLRADQDNSDTYFEVIADLCDDVSKHFNEKLGKHLENFELWFESTSPPKTISREESIFTILNLGILWDLYSSPARESKRFVRWTLSWLVFIRKKNQLVKPIADLLRGIITGIPSFSKTKEIDPAVFSLQNFRILMDWLSASGEYNEIVINLQTYHEFLSTLSKQKVKEVFQTIKELAKWFKKISLKRLGSYTENVDHFLEKEHPNYRWREDNLFTGRKRIEYHLNMLGSEILNRRLKQSFVETSDKIVILPPCMKAKHDDDCEARQTPFGEQCMNCTPGCRINQITKLGEKHGFRVLIIPDELKVFSSSDVDADRNFSRGVLGVACPLTNAPGGLEMIQLGVPAQGLPLDYCGCSYHWHKDGIPTDLNIRQLMQLINQTNDDQESE